MVVPNIHRKFGADWPKHLGGDSPPTDRSQEFCTLSLSCVHFTRYSFYFAHFFYQTARLSPRSLIIFIKFHLFSFGHTAHNIKSLENERLDTQILSLSHCDMMLRTMHPHCQSPTNEATLPPFKLSIGLGNAADREKSAYSRSTLHAC